MHTIKELVKKVPVETVVAADFNLKGQTNIHPSYYYANERYNGKDYDGLWELHFCMHSKFSDILGVSGSINYGNTIARRFDTKGKRTFAYFGVDFKPVDRLFIEPEIRFERSEEVDSGVELYEGFVTRTRLNYQITPKLSLRLVTQYNDFNQCWDIDPLITYRLNPFSVFYLGSTYDYEDFATVEGEPTSWQLSSRQFFMKLQYLFQI